MFTQDEMETILYVLEDHARDNANDYMVRKINAICDKMNEVIVPMPIECFVDDECFLRLTISHSLTIALISALYRH